MFGSSWRIARIAGVSGLRAAAARARLGAPPTTNSFLVSRSGVTVGMLAKSATLER